MWLKPAHDWSTEQLFAHSMTVWALTLVTSLVVSAHTAGELVVIAYVVNDTTLKPSLQEPPTFSVIIFIISSKEKNRFRAVMAQSQNCF